MKPFQDFRVLSLDLFDTLVRVRGFDPRHAFEKCHSILIDAGIQIDFNHFYTSYRSKIRHYLSQREITGNDFTNDILVQELLNELGHNVDIALSKRVVEAYFHALVPYTVPYHGMESTIKLLKEDFELIMTSNHSWPDHGNKVLEKIGIKSYFKKIMFSGELGRAKPHPEIFEEALKGIDKKLVLHVGDNPIADVDGAQRFGLYSLWVHSRDHFRDKKLVLPTLKEKLVGEIRQINELPDFLGINSL